MRVRILSLFLLVALPVASAPAESRRITLSEAVDLALRDNALLKIARLKVRETDAKRRAARTDYFPKLSNESQLWHTLNRQEVVIPAGALGVYSGVGLIPKSPIRIEQGGDNLFLTGTTLGQPLTQLLKIRQGHRIAQLDEALASNDLKKAENEIALKVHEIYFAVLISQRQRRALELQVAAAEEKLRDSQRAVQTGNALEVAEIGSRANLLERRHALLALENQISDLTVEFNDMLGLPLDTEVDLVTPPPADASPASIEECMKIALAESPEVRAAQQTVEKARSAVIAARTDYIPELSLFAEHIYQSGVPLLAKNNGILGLKMTWNIFDFGKRGDVVDERKALFGQAEENLRRLRNRVLVDVEKGYRKVDRSRRMVEVAGEALVLRREAERLSSDQLETGVAVLAAYKENAAALAKAEADALAAQLGFQLAQAELERTMGRTAR